MHDFIAKLEQSKALFVLTGAGISHSSGIPTYRDAKGKWLGSQPIQHADFLAFESVRQRYWARSLVGWRNFGRAAPNEAHRALVDAETKGRISLLVTQNVDRLHQQAGSRQVVDLHGRLDQVLCLQCREYSPRTLMQQRLEAANPNYTTRAEQLRPDGDADIPDSLVTSVRVPPCDRCGGVLKPDVVFFGDNVPAQRVLQCQQALHNSDAMLVVGSSLQVYSGYRFCRQAAEQGTPIYSVNPGVTRADELLSDRCIEPAEKVLSQWMSGPQ